MFYKDISDGDTVLDILQDLINADQFEADVALISNVWDAHGVYNAFINVQSGDVSVADIMWEDVIDI